MKQYITTLALFLLVSLAGVPVHAQFDKGFDNAESIAETNKLSTGTLRGFIEQGINIALTLVGVIAVGIIIYGGIMYITSAGDESKAQRAKTLILYAVIGLLLIGLAALIVNVVISTFDGGGGGGDNNNNQ